MALIVRVLAMLLELCKISEVLSVPRLRGLAALARPGALRLRLPRALVARAWPRPAHARSCPRDRTARRARTQRHGFGHRAR
eukprot:132499-Alexandrium_andersonii.AAC.1